MLSLNCERNQKHAHSGRSLGSDSHRLVKIRWWSGGINVNPLVPDKSNLSKSFPTVMSKLSTMLATNKCKNIFASSSPGHILRVKVKETNNQPTKKKHSTVNGFTFCLSGREWSEGERKTFRQHQQSGWGWNAAEGPKSPRPCERHSVAVKPSISRIL